MDGLHIFRFKVLMIAFYQYGPIYLSGGKEGEAKQVRERGLRCYSICNGVLTK